MTQVLPKFLLNHACYFNQNLHRLDLLSNCNLSINHLMRRMRSLLTAQTNQDPPTVAEKVPEYFERQRHYKSKLGFS